VRVANEFPSKIETSERVYSVLSSIRWDFNDADAGRQSIHAFHSYPAKFIPEIPRAIIRALPPSSGTVVFDPFCGCGTTLVEAQSAGHASVGVDLNPIGCLVSKVKTTPLPDNFASEVDLCISRARSMSALPLPSIPNLDHWFAREVSNVLAALRASICQVRDAAVKQALEAVLSSIIVRVSNQDSDTRYAAVEKQVSTSAVYEVFAQTARSLSAISHSAELWNKSPATVINRDIFDITPDEIPGEVGLVITSPPYPNAYEYWLYHKYRMWWLGYDPIAVKAKEIGARAHFFSGRRSLEDFYFQMSKVFRLLAAAMRKGGYCCFVVGDSKIHGEIVDNSAHVVAAASECGFELVFKCDREINPHRKSFNLHHARIKKEHVIVWQR
jgi:site-specific DNA-methyltransferase (cytosine-N4-specific)